MSVRSRFPVGWYEKCWMCAWWRARRWATAAGAHGGAERWSAPALQARFVDATGAGDAADAGFLLQYLRDRADVPAALRSANAAGACAVAAAGGCVRPVAREEYLALVSAATEK